MGIVGKRGIEGDCHWYGIFLGDENILELIVVRAVQVYDYTENCRIEHFKWANHWCVNYLNKTVKIF